MNLSTADLGNYRTEFHETWWSYRYMFLVDPKVFRFVVKGVKAIFLGVHGHHPTPLFWYLGFHGNAILNFINTPKVSTHYSEYSYDVS
jgi:hypothetical protein